MIHTERVTLATEGSRTFDAHLARPVSGSGTGLVVLHDMFGASRVFLDLAERHARRGHCVLVPDLFWRSEPAGVLTYDEPHDVAWARERAFDSGRAVEDLRIAADWLRASPACTGKVAVLGFCFSGQLAYLAAARIGIDAAIAFYALGISKHLGEIDRIDCPVQLHYGLDDQHVPRAEIDPVRHAADGRSNIAVHLYPGAGHSFYNPIRPTFDAEASRQADERVDRLLAGLA